MFDYRYTLRALSIALVALSVVLSSCSATRELSDGQARVKSEKAISTNKKSDIGFLNAYLRHRSAALKRKQMQIYDSVIVEKRSRELLTLAHQEGYLNAKVTPTVDVKKQKARVRYLVDTGEPYFVHSVKYNIADTTIARLIRDDVTNIPLRRGSKFSIDLLSDTRNAITNLLKSKGYYKFNKDYIHFDADTTFGSRLIDLTTNVESPRSNETDSIVHHRQYHIGNVEFVQAENNPSRLRRKVVENNMLLKTGDIYDANKLQRTYNNYSRLHAIKYTNIRFSERPDTTLLDARVTVVTGKANTISFQPEGTNTAGNLGAAAQLTYENRNLFRGSETLSIGLRAAFEAITGLEGYQNKDYEEYGVETKLLFPRLILPFVSSRTTIHSTASSELSLSYSLQNRPEFHRRVFTSAWRYRWEKKTPPHANYSFRVDVLDLNYIYMPWIAPTFKSDYLDNASTRNAILRYNYEDLFLMKTGFSFRRSTLNSTMRFNIETAGNLLSLLSVMTNTKTNNMSERTIFNIAYAQYVKTDIDYSHTIKLTPRTRLVVHGAFGFAYPYGNSTVLPFEKRYFAGGANSVRGWSIRQLGPGKYRTSDGKIDFINQTGDVKLDLNAEYRLPLFWKFDGAAFIDAGNIWTLRDYPDQPRGKFSFSHFLTELAVSYGIGLRLNFDYFVLRFDCGVKAINPSYTTNREHFPIFHPRFSRDVALHFAVGLPF